MHLRLKMIPAVSQKLTSLDIKTALNDFCHRYMVPTGHIFRNHFFHVNIFLVVFCNICDRNRLGWFLIGLEIYKENFCIGKLVSKKVTWWEPCRCRLTSTPVQVNFICFFPTSPYIYFKITKVQCMFNYFFFLLSHSFP